MVATAENGAKANGTDFSVELGDLYFNRMLRSTGIKSYESDVEKLLKETSGAAEQATLAVVA